MKKMILGLLLCGIIGSLCSANVIASSYKPETSATSSKAENDNYEAITLKKSYLYSDEKAENVKFAIPKGADLIVIQETDQWYYVEYKNNKGFVDKSAVDVRKTNTETEDEVENPAVEEDTAIVLRPSIIRSKPSYSFETLLKLKAGDVVHVIEVCTEKHVGTDWCIVEKDGIQGYIPKSKLDFDSTTAISSTEAETTAISKEDSAAYANLEDLSIKDIRELQNAITIVLEGDNLDKLDKQYLYLEDMTVKELKGLRTAIDEILSDENEVHMTSSSGSMDEMKDSEEETETKSLQEILLEGVAAAYWDMYPSLIDPESYRVVWVKNYEDTEILIANLGKASDGKYYDIYVDSYNIKDGTRTSLGKERELPEKYKNATELDWNEAVEYSKRSDSGVDPLPECLITRKEAEKLLKNISEIGETYTDATTIRLVQQALNKAGFDCGTPDGIAGSKTAAAISAYEEQEEIEVNGIITDQLIKCLGIEEDVKHAIELEESKASYSTEITYQQMARNPETYLYQKIKVHGKVLQADVRDDTGWMLLEMNNNYDTIVYITYNKNLINYRFLEDDILTVYGHCGPLYSYKAVSGATNTTPWIDADIIELN